MKHYNTTANNKHLRDLSLYVFIKPILSMPISAYNKTKISHADTSASSFCISGLKSFSIMPSFNLIILLVIIEISAS